MGVVTLFHQAHFSQIMSQERVKGVVSLVKQCENIYMLMAPTSCNVIRKSRLDMEEFVLFFLIQYVTSMLVNRCHYPGSNRGDTIYGVVMPSFDDKKCWKLLLSVSFLSSHSSIQLVNYIANGVS